MSGVTRPYADYPLFSVKDDIFLTIERGFTPGMNVPVTSILSPSMRDMLVKELRSYKGRSFVPTLQQAANAACLPGVVSRVVTLPDAHCGYGFPVGGVCAMDVGDPRAVVAPGVIGFDANCSARCIRTNLHADDLTPEIKEQLAQALFDHVPVGVGSQGIIPATTQSLSDAFAYGMDWSLREGYAWAEDKEHCEEFGRMMNADPKVLSSRVYRRGLPAIASIGSGNHYCEVQTVDRIYDRFAARRMGIEEEGQVVILLHTGSRSAGHQLQTDALCLMERHMHEENIVVPDQQLACARIATQTGQQYLAGLACVANYGFVNRQAITFLIRQAFSKVFGETPDDLDMQLVYDSPHNMAKLEEHVVDGRPKTLLVHRKGATRCFGPNHPAVPVDYQACGQPVVIGGSMGTSSWLMTGTQRAMDLTFGTTCHGAGRNASRAASRREVDYTDVLSDLRSSGISVRVASPHLLMEEAPSSYKDVDEVVDTCARAGISMPAVRMKPQIVVKG